MKLLLMRIQRTDLQKILDFLFRENTKLSIELKRIK